MFAVPKKRLFVYLVAGLVVFAVGAAGLLATRSPEAIETDGVLLDVTEGLAAAGAAEPEPPGSATGPPADALRPADGTSVSQESLIFVQVAGAVHRPGVYQMPAGARAFQAIVQAGGFAGDADQQTVPLASRLTDGCRLYVPRQGETVSGSLLSGDQVAGGSGSTATGGLVSLNSATVEQLDTLPGIGPALARKIVGYREAQGPFTSIDQLSDVPGIGPSKLEELRPLVTL